MQLHVIETGLFKLDGGAMFGVVPKSMWSKQYPADENNMCTWEMRCLLVEDGNRLILIDTGIGDKQDDKFFSHYYLHGDASLIHSIQKAGYSPDEITDVFLTHLHFDHCGGAIKRDGDRLVPTFKNAIYWSNDAHWHTATQPNPREKASFLKDNILPIQESGQLKFIPTTDHYTFSDHIEVLFFNGHSDAMMCPLISYKDKKILYCADLFPAHVHIPIPWVMAYDMQPLVTMSEKTRTLEYAIKNDVILFFEHDHSTECASLVQTEKGIKIDQKFSLQQI